MSRSPVNATSTVGIDIGSRTIKVVRLTDGEIEYAKVFDTGHDPLKRIRDEFGEMHGTPIVATGYGRRLAQTHFSCKAVTEISACARGVHYIDASCTSVIDIGGQDTKAIEIKDNGSFGRFEMNDRCAAGTGKFLEVMAHALGGTVETFGSMALGEVSPVMINSMCTVFAESEVISLIARGESRGKIALGLHIAIAKRVAALASRIELGNNVFFAGGVANNPCIVEYLKSELGRQLIVPERPELVVAIGAALIGNDTLEK